MHVGVSIPQVGRLADPDAIRAAALAAEQLGYVSVWALDRALAPERQIVLDPIGTLTLASAVTERIMLGTSVLITLWDSPLLLTRSLTTLDRISRGRLVVAVVPGLPADGFEGSGAPVAQLGDRLDATLDVLDAAWGAERATEDDRLSTIARRDNWPTRRSRRRPPVLLADSTRAGLDRVARRADGWNPSGLPVEWIGPMWNDVRDRAATYARDPEQLTLVVRANIVLSDRPIGGRRPSYHGSIEQVADDLVATRDAGAHEVVLCLIGDLALDESLDRHARLAEALDLSGDRPAGGWRLP